MRVFPKSLPEFGADYVQMDIARVPLKNPVYERRSSSDCFLQIFYFVIRPNWIYCSGGQRSHSFGRVLS